MEPPRMEWKLITNTARHPYLQTDDECYSLNEYTIEGGYDASKTNQSIFNFKAEVKEIASYRWEYKEKAVEEFSDALRNFRPPYNRQHVFVMMPTSKCRADESYDPRFDMLRKILGPNEGLFTWKRSLQASHLGGPRDPKVFIDNLRWDGFKRNDVHVVLLVDEVIVTGAHFRACKDFIMMHKPPKWKLKVLGLFWASCVYADPGEPKIPAAKIASSSV